MNKAVDREICKNLILSWEIYGYQSLNQLKEGHIYSLVIYLRSEVGVKWLDMTYSTFMASEFFFKWNIVAIAKCSYNSNSL